MQCTGVRLPTLLPSGSAGHAKLTGKLRIIFVPPALAYAWFERQLPQGNRSAAAAAVKPCRAAILVTSKIGVIAMC